MTATVLAVVFAAACDTATSSSGAELAARGFAWLADGETERARECLERAVIAEPESAIVERDLAVVYARQGRVQDALVHVERAIALGDADPEASLLRAMLLEADGRRADAVQVAAATETAEGILIGASLRDPAAVHRAADLAQEDTPRAALAALVLAADAGERGLEGVARLLADTAQTRAAAAREPDIQNAAREMEKRLDEHGRVITGARLRATIDHSTNPLYVERPSDSALRLALTGELALEAPIGIARFDAALRVDQHAVLRHRDQFRELDLTLLGAALSVEIPISPRPSAALLGLRARFQDAFGKVFDIHYATAFEAGPYLVLPLGASLAIEMGFYGVAVDFIDRSPADGNISSQNRDRVGQRAAFALTFTADRVDGRLEATFLRDDALGDAFDTLGGVFSAHLRAYPGDGIILGTSVSAAAREFGPVGDLAIIGPAATRTEVRNAVALSARIPLVERLWLVAEDVWIRNNARRGHAFTENVISLGAEAVW